MAKKTVASLQKKGAKAFTKAVKMVKNETTGSYSFKSEIVPKDKVIELDMTVESAAKLIISAGLVMPEKKD